MKEVTFKEKRMTALDNIITGFKKLEDLSLAKTYDSSSDASQRIAYLESLLESAKIRISVVNSYLEVLNFQDVYSLRDCGDFLVPIYVLETKLNEIKSLMENNLKDLKKSLKGVVKSQETSSRSYKYYNDLFDEVFKQDNEYWEEVTKYGNYVINLNAKTHARREEEIKEPLL